MALKTKKLYLVAQPIPYFASQIAPLIDFDIQVTATKAALEGATKGSIEKAKIVVVEKSENNSKILSKLIEATILDYKGLKLVRQGQIELTTNAKK